MTRERFVRARYDDHLHYWANVGLAIGVPMVLALATLDSWVAPELFRDFLVYRIATSLGLLALLGLNQIRVRSHFQSLLGLAAGTMVSIMTALMIYQLGGHRSAYFVGFIVVLVFVCGFLPLHPGYGIAAALVVLGAYLLPILAYDRIVDERFFITAVALTLLCAAAVLLFQYLNYRRLIAEFGLRYDLERQRSGLEDEIRERTAELRHSKASLETLITASPLSIIALDPTQKVTLWNPAAERMFGWSAAEVIGGPDPLTTPEAQPLIHESIERLRRGETISSIETESRRKDGAIIPLRISTAPLRDADGANSGFMCVLADITEQKNMLQQILVAKNEWEESFNTINDAITIHDRDFNILRANRAAESLLGLPLPAITSRKCHELFHGSVLPPGSCPSCITLRTGEPALTEIFEPNLKRHLEIKALPRLDGQGRVIGLVHVVRDLTEANKLRAQLLQAQKMEAVGQLAGGIAHDFNNILSAIYGYGELLREKLGPEEARCNYLDQILACAERAATLTQHLLAFSRTQVISVKPVELSAIVRTLRKLLERLIRENIELRLDLAQDDLVVIADAGQIEQVLMNLSANARDAMPGGGRLTIATKRFELREDFIAQHGYGAPGPFALLSVSDTGHGMDEATRTRIFEPFFTTKEPGHGTGLGLAMVYGIVKQHNGFIQVESAPGEGTRFTILLPVDSARQPQPDEKPKPAAALPRGSETILLAEDEGQLRDLLQQILEESGYRVLPAGDGEDAVRAAREHDGPIHLLLLDVVMPRMGGKEACKGIRATRPEARSLFMSGYPRDAATVRELWDPGMQIVAKPLSPAKLLQAVRRALDQGPTSSAC